MMLFLCRTRAVLVCDGCTPHSMVGAHCPLPDQSDLRHLSSRAFFLLLLRCGDVRKMLHKDKGRGLLRQQGWCASEVRLLCDPTQTWQHFILSQHQSMCLNNGIHASRLLYHPSLSAHYGIYLIYPFARGREASVCSRLWRSHLRLIKEINNSWHTAALLSVWVPSLRTDLPCRSDELNTAVFPSASLWLYWEKKLEGNTELGPQQMSMNVARVEWEHGLKISPSVFVLTNNMQEAATGILFTWCNFTFNLM